jgi:hypothetical protein
MRGIIKIKLGLIGGLLLLIVALIFSDKALPSSPELYNLKRLQEKIFMLVKTSPQDKVNYYNLLLDKRLEEILAIIQNRDFNLILSSSLRYSTTAGLMTDLIKSNHLTDASSLVLEKFKKHQIIFKNLDDAYPKDEGQEWKYIQDDYNYLSIYSQQLKDAFGN